MGSYLILNAPSLSETADYVGEPQLTQTWQPIGADILFTDTALSDAECAALYAGYVPSGADDMTYHPPLPPAVLAARQTVKAFWEANPSAVTDTQTATLLRALVTWERWRNRELTDD